MITSGYSEIMHTLETRVLTALAYSAHDLDYVPVGGRWDKDSAGTVGFRFTDIPIKSALWKKDKDREDNITLPVVTYHTPRQFVEVQITAKVYENVVAPSHKIVKHFINSKDFDVDCVGNFNDNTYYEDYATRTFTFSIVSQDFCNNELNTQEIINESTNNWGLNATTISKIG